jgi:hypothetical protein
MGQEQNGQAEERVVEKYLLNILQKNSDIARGARNSSILSVCC